MASQWRRALLPQRWLHQWKDWRSWTCGRQTTICCQWEPESTGWKRCSKSCWTANWLWFMIGWELDEIKVDILQSRAIVEWITKGKLKLQALLRVEWDYRLQHPDSWVMIPNLNVRICTRLVASKIQLPLEESSRVCLQGLSWTLSACHLCLSPDTWHLTPGPVLSVVADWRATADRHCSHCCSVNKSNVFIFWRNKSMCFL